ncbi:MAG: MoaD/ThiS family protein [Anaerolineae bacterium]
MSEATIRYHDRTWQVRSGMTVRDAMKKLELDPQTVLAVRNKKLINEETLLEPGDEVRLVNVISGG